MSSQVVLVMGSYRECDERGCDVACDSGTKKYVLECTIDMDQQKIGFKKHGKHYYESSDKKYKWKEVFIICFFGARNALCREAREKGCD